MYRLLFVFFLSVLSWHSLAERVSHVEQQLDRHTQLPFLIPSEVMLQQWLQQLESQPDSASWYRAYSLLLLQQGITQVKGLEAKGELQALLERIDAQALSAQAEVYSALAELLLYHQHYSTALELVEPMQTMLSELQHPRLVYQFNHQIGRMLKANGQLEEALTYFLTAHLEITQLNDGQTEFRRQFLQLHMARIQSRLQNYRYSRQIASQALEVAYREGFQVLLAELHLIYGAAIHMLEGPTDEALAQYHLASKPVEGMMAGRTQMMALNNLGAVHLHRANYEQALGYLQHGVVIAGQLNNEREVHVMSFNIGYIQVLQGQTETGLRQMEQAYEAYKAKTTPVTQGIMLGHLADAYHAAGLYEQENAALRQHRRIREKVLEVERDRVYSELQVQFEAQEQGLRIQLLEQESLLRDERLATAHRENLWYSGLITLLLLGFIAAMLAMRHTRKLNSQLQELSKRDPLTQLYNRRALHDVKQQGGDLVLLLDVDHFKQINDQHGHDKGDTVLAELAQRLMNKVRKEDWVLRWGGEEFLLILRGVEADTAIESIQKVVAAVCDQPIAELDVSVSGGAVLLRDAEAMQQVLKQADLLLYRAKELGRKRILYQADHQDDPVEVSR
ncbi:GGDEF domain-containing protein [Alkalimonas collagenimarina]|uniref:diguanylate cyclase n=1 Tax=Alkalimonas collagenimarina TaxID=400390 RepID=A0ABT9H2B1_9GAMM|nr:GGDEF domain-containing protein [Alkalimonas collagenimarina]MDP4537040.1 GGDEF domain-containing protein [Alkalimonas collagenimarina]